MYLWKFHASANWLRLHEHELEKLPAGNVAIITRPGRAQRIVEVTCATRAAATDLALRFGGSFEQLPLDWANKYLHQQQSAPLRIGRRLLVATKDQQSTTPQLVIPAAGAFGTGEHATTAMCLRLVEESTRTFSLGWNILDIGTGTGILALAAKRFGASEALGIDLDLRAIAHAKENARRNNILKIEFVRADILRWKSRRRFDLITANLFSELLIAALPKLDRALRAKGRIILSGILREQAASVTHALRRRDFEIAQQRRRGKWIALLATRKT